MGSLALPQLQDATLEMGWGGVGAINVPWHLHLVCITVTKHAATLADVVNLRKHKFHGTFRICATRAHALGSTPR